MTALPPVPAVVRIRWLLDEGTDDEVGTSIFVQYGGTAPTIAQMDTFATSVATAWNTDLAALTTSDATLTTVKTEDLTSATAAVGEATVSHAGTRTGNYLSLNVAFSLQYHTLLRRRGGRWHGQHRFGVFSDLVSSQNWSTTFVSDVLSAWSGFITAVLAAGWSGAGTLTHVGVQYYCPPNKTVTSSTGRVRTVSSLVGTTGADLPAPVVYEVTGYDAFQRVGSQRKRLGKSGT